MATINSENNSLTGSIGSGSFVGTNSPAFTGVVDCSNVSVEIPNNNAPTISQEGQIAIDTSIPGFQPLITYHNGSSSQSVISLLPSDFSIQDGSVVAYDLVNSKFVMQQEISGKAIIQYNIISLGANSTTNSTSPVASGLSGSITPTISTNKIVCEVLGYSGANRTSTSSNTRYGTLYLRVQVGINETALSEFIHGRILNSNDASSAISYTPFSWYYEEIPGSTTARSYTIWFSSPTGVTSTIYAGTNLLLYEIEV